MTATVSIEGPTISTSIATTAVYAPEDLLAMPDGKNYELVDGQVVERQMGAESTWVGTRLVPIRGKKARNTPENPLPARSAPGLSMARFPS